MDTIFMGLDFALTYLDDILIWNKTEDEHVQYLLKVFECIKEYKLGENKCEFFYPEC